MDKRTLIAQLHALFCEEFKKNGKYATVWLSDVVPELYKSEKFHLHIVPKEEIESAFDEIVYINRLLTSKLNDAFENIRATRVHYLRYGWSCGREDYMVFDYHEKCSKCEEIQMQLQAIK